MGLIAATDFMKAVPIAFSLDPRSLRVAWHGRLRRERRREALRSYFEVDGQHITGAAL